MERIADNERGALGLDLQAHWEQLRDGNPLPMRAKFDVLAVPDLLPDLIVVDVGSADTHAMPIRFAGSAYRDRTGLDLMGMDIADLFEASDPVSLWADLRTTADRPCGIVQHTAANYAAGQNAILEITILPLSGGPEELDQVLIAAERIDISLDEGSDADIVLNTSRKWSWIDLGHGVPDY